jgi:hypothetical protein
MSASRAFQKAIAARLKAHAGVAALVGARVYDTPPADAVCPYLSFGPSSAVPDDEEGIWGREETLQIDVWTRANGLLHPCREITDAVYDALHEVTLDLDMPYANVETNVTLLQVFQDPDGITGHGVVQVTGMVERI